jgi:hypothetical protein
VDIGAADTDACNEDEATAKDPLSPQRHMQASGDYPTVNGNTVFVPIVPAVATLTPISSQLPAPSCPCTRDPSQEDKQKKEKAAPQPIAPAPVAQADEPSQEETNGKKKAKSGRSTRANETDADKENVAAVTEKVKADKACKGTKRDRSKRKLLLLEHLASLSYFLPFFRPLITYGLVIMQPADRC